MVSETTNNILGALGGVILAACLAPQLIRLYMTRSARDISILFLMLYTTGLLFMALYLTFLEDALVAVVSIFFELGIAVVTVAAKIYLDRWGPHPNATFSNKTSTNSLKNAARTDVTKFLTGTGGAPFPLIAHEESHAAQHLLLDCSIAVGGGGLAKQKINSNGSSAETTDGAVLIDSLETGSFQSNGIAIGKDGDVLKEAVCMVEAALEGAGLEVDKRHFKQLSSFRTNTTATSQNSTGAVLGGSRNMNSHEMSFIGCRDGYATLIWYEESETLAVDFLAAGEENAPAVNAAAQQFGAQLLERYPGSVIEASAVPRLKRRN